MDVIHSFMSDKQHMMRKDVIATAKLYRNSRQIQAVQMELNEQ